MLKYYSMNTEAFPNSNDKELIEAFSTLKNKNEIQAFLRDLFTLSELKEASRRFQIAKKLWHGDTNYLKIASEVHTSTTTVTRVSDWLFNQGLNGYQIALQRLYPKKKVPSKPTRGSKKFFPR